MIGQASDRMVAANMLALLGSIVLDKEGIKIRSQALCLPSLGSIRISLTVERGLSAPMRISRTVLVPSAKCAVTPLPLTP